jgi:hypothetical protein
VRLGAFLAQALPGASNEGASSSHPFDLKTWTNVGQPFVAATSEVVQEFNAIEVGQFSRLYEVQ